LKFTFAKTQNRRGQRHSFLTPLFYDNRLRMRVSRWLNAPADCLTGLSEVIGEERDRKLEEARERRQAKRLREKQVA